MELSCNQIFLHKKSTKLFIRQASETWFHIHFFHLRFDCCHNLQITCFPLLHFSLTPKFSTAVFKEAHLLIRPLKRQRYASSYLTRRESVRLRTGCVKITFRSLF